MNLDDPDFPYIVFHTRDSSATRAEIDQVNSIFLYLHHAHSSNIIDEEGLQACLRTASERAGGLLIARRLLHHRWPLIGDFDRICLSEAMGVTAQQFQVLRSNLGFEGRRMVIRERHHPERAKLSFEYCPPESALLLLLYRLRFPRRYCDMEELFGHDKSTLARVWSAAIDRLYAVAARCVSRIPSLASPSRCRAMADAIGLGNCVGFIDGTHKEVRRPTYFQQNAYSGYHAEHCISFQAVCTPDGMLSVSPPFPGRAVRRCNAPRRVHGAVRQLERHPRRVLRPWRRDIPSG